MRMNLTPSPAAPCDRRRATFAFAVRALPLAILLLALALAAGCRKKSADERLEEIDLLFRQGNMISAVLKAKELIRELPEDPAALDARAMLAQYYLSTGDPDRALEFLEEIYKPLGILDPRGAQSFSMTLQILGRQENYDKAIALLEWAIPTVPHDSSTSTELNLLRAQLRLEKGDTAATGSILAIMKTAGAEELRHAARETLANYHRSKGRFDRAIETYQEWIERYPDHPVRRHLEVMMGVDLMKMGREAEGAALFGKGMTQLIEDAEAELDKQKAAQKWFEVARYYDLADQVEPAVVYYEKLRKDYADVGSVSWDSTRAQLDMYMRAKRFDDALALLQPVADGAPERQETRMAAMFMERIREIKAQEAGTSPTLSAPPAAPDAGS